MEKFGHRAAKQAAEETVQVEIARQQPPSLVDVRHGEVRSLTIAVPAAGEGKWLVARVPDASVQALLSHAAGLPESQRASFINDWIKLNQDAMYAAYQQFTDGGGSGRRFSYAPVPVESVTVAEQVVRGPFGIVIPRAILQPPTPAATTTQAAIQPAVTSTPRPSTPSSVAATETTPTVVPAPATRPGRVIGEALQPGIDEETGHVLFSFNVMSSAGNPVAVSVDMDSELGIIDHETYPTPADRARYLATSLQGALSRSTFNFLGILSGSRDKVAVTIDGEASDLDSLRRLFETGNAEAPAEEPVPAPAAAVPVETRALSVRFTERGDGSEENPYVVEPVGGSGRRLSGTLFFGGTYFKVTLRESQLGTAFDDLRQVCGGVMREKQGIVVAAGDLNPPIRSFLQALQR